MISLLITCYLVLFLCYAIGEFLPLFFVARKRYQTVKEFPPLSVVIPIKNEEAVIKKAIERWMQVAYPNTIELLFCDQDSKDATPHIIKEEIKKHPSISYHNFSGKNKLEALLEGVKKARFSTIVLSDVDRFPNTSGLSHLVQYLSDPIVCVFGRGRVVENRSFQKQMTTLDFLNNMIDLPFFCHISSAPSLYLHSCVIKKEVLLSMKPEKLIADDLYLATEIVKQQKKALFIPNVVVGDEHVIDFSDVMKRKLRTYQGSIQVILSDFLHTGFHNEYGLFGLALVPFNHILTLGKILTFLFTIILSLSVLLGAVSLTGALTLLLILYLLLLLSQIIRFLLFKKYFPESVTHTSFLTVCIQPLFTLIIRRWLWGYDFFTTILGVNYAWKQSQTDRQ